MNRPIREKDIERYFCEEIKRHGGIAFKFTSPQRRSVPDRLVIMPNGYCAFVEVKKQDGVRTPGQVREQERLEALGHDVFNVYNKSDAASLACNLAIRSAVRE